MGDVQFLISPGERGSGGTPPAAAAAVVVLSNHTASFFIMGSGVNSGGATSQFIFSGAGWARGLAARLATYATASSTPPNTTADALHLSEMILPPYDPPTFASDLARGRIVLPALLVRGAAVVVAGDRGAAIWFASTRLASPAAAPNVLPPSASWQNNFLVAIESSLVCALSYPTQTTTASAPSLTGFGTVVVYGFFRPDVVHAGDPLRDEAACPVTLHVDQSALVAAGVVAYAVSWTLQRDIAVPRDNLTQLADASLVVVNRSTLLSQHRPNGFKLAQSAIYATGLAVQGDTVVVVQRSQVVAADVLSGPLATADVYGIRLDLVASFQPGDTAAASVLCPRALWLEATRGRRLGVRAWGVYFRCGRPPNPPPPSPFDASPIPVATTDAKWGALVALPTRLLFVFMADSRVSLPTAITAGGTGVDIVGGDPTGPANSIMVHAGITRVSISVSVSWFTDGALRFFKTALSQLTVVNSSFSVICAINRTALASCDGIRAVVVWSLCCFARCLSRRPARDPTRAA